MVNELLKNLLDMKNIKDVIGVIRILIWIGFVLTILGLTFDLSTNASHIIAEDDGKHVNMAAIMYALCYPLLLLFWTIDIKPFKSVWRFLVALIPFLLIAGVLIYILYLRYIYSIAFKSV